MATLQFGDIAVDMRLANDGYGVPSYQQFNSFMVGFTAVRETSKLGGEDWLVRYQYDELGQQLYTRFRFHGDILDWKFRYFEVLRQDIVERHEGSYKLHGDGILTGTTNAIVVSLLDSRQQPHELLRFTGFDIVINSPRDHTALLGGADSIVGAGGDDWLLGFSGDDTLRGGGGNDTLAGGDGGDLVDGGSGVDTVDYGAATSGVRVNLLAGRYRATEGSSNDKLNGIENVLGSDFPDALSGSSLVNRLCGAGGNDTINGAEGADSMEGGDGSDTYSVDDIGDAVIEINSNPLIGGVDRVRSTINWTLASDVERLVLVGANAINGTGNTGANVLSGNAAANELTGLGGADTLVGGGGNDLLKGGDGNDRLSGGPGNEAFLFDTTLDNAANRDTVTDFAPGEDKLHLDHDIFRAFTGSTSVAAAQFYAAASATLAHDSDDRIVYNTSTGALYYDSDGINGASSVQFAVLTGAPTLTATDFSVVG